MTPRPPIFISAVSRELRSARQLVANTLTFLGYQPIWQDIFGTEGGDLRGMLRQQVDQCKGVVQLVGNCYGAEPPAPDEEFGRVSYTQFEALYGRKRGKKVWYLFIDEHFPADPHEPEPPELRELQDTYRRRIKSDAHLFHPLASREALEASVLKLRDDLTRLRRGVKQWAAVVLGLLVAIAVGGVWQFRASQMAGEQQQHLLAKQDETNRQLDAMRQIIAQFPQKEGELRQSEKKEDPDAARRRALEELAKQYGLDPKKLEKDLLAAANDLKRASNASTLDRANAAYVTKDYSEAERLALQAADEAQKAVPANNEATVKAYELAAQAARTRVAWDNALRHLQDAAKLTDRKRDFKLWQRVQHEIARIILDQGQVKEAETMLRGLLSEDERKFTSEDLDILSDLAEALFNQNKLADAENELRRALSLGGGIRSAEDRMTLKTRHDLAAVLSVESFNAKAEEELRKVLTIQERTLGPAHEDTINTRGDIAFILCDQGKLTEAAAEFDDLIRLSEANLGPEHPQTLSLHKARATVLTNQRKYSEAERELGQVLAIRERVFGAEHRDTLNLRIDHDTLLAYQKKFTEAEDDLRKLLELSEKLFGQDDALPWDVRGSLAPILILVKKYDEALNMLRAVMSREERLLGPENQETLITRFLIGQALIGTGKYRDAETELRAVLKIQERVLGAEHPDASKTRTALANAMSPQPKAPEIVPEKR